MSQVAIGRSWANELGGPLLFEAADATTVLTGAARKARTGDELAYVVTANLDHLRVLGENARFRAAYQGAAARTLDGTPLVWAARLRGNKSAQRVTGHDLLREMLRNPALESPRFFVLCNTEETGNAVVRKFQEEGYSPDQVSYFVPAFGFENDAELSAEIVERVRAHGTTNLIMGVGAPKSEIWCNGHRRELPGIVALCIGDAVSVYAGLKSRAPKLLQTLGLEWAFRFLQEPQRLFSRYFSQSWRGVRRLVVEIQPR